MAGAFDGRGQVALMARARAGLAARANLAALTDEAAQHIGLLVVNALDLVDAELAHLGARGEFAATALAARAAAAATRAARSPIRRRGRRLGF